MTPRTLVEPRPRTTRVLMASIAVAVAAGLAVWLSAGVAFAVTPYDPLLVITDENFRDAGSMSQAEVQAFLETMPGILKTYTAVEHGTHGGAIKPASQIIWEAAQANNISPKVILTTLQKEQSLLTYVNPSKTRLDRAMGCGVYSGSPDYHVGFGDQVWTGAQKLSTYEITYKWFPGLSKNVWSYPDDHRINIVVKNAATFALYTYTPYYPQVGFWNIHVKYFGDPQESPRFKAMYEFKGRSTGAYYYTSSSTERYRLIARSSRTWEYKGVVFSVDASGTSNVVPLWRLKNNQTGRYLLTAWASEKNALLAKRYRRRAVWSLQAVTAYVALDPTNGTAVYRMYNSKRKTYYYTTSYAELRSLVAQHNGGWRSQGVCFYLGSYVPPVPPSTPTTPTAG